jgi:hypothetical protein
MTQVFLLTTGSTGMQSWANPGNWNPVNTVECMGAGQLGGSNPGSNLGGGGGMGGTYSIGRNLTLTFPVSYCVMPGTMTGYLCTTFNGSNSNQIGSNPGPNVVSATGNGTNNLAYNWPAAGAYNGGPGGPQDASGWNNGAGGGGAAGPRGPGNGGGGVSSVPGGGGTGDGGNTAGGAPGTSAANGGQGGTGNYWDASHGGGGGGGGGNGYNGNKYLGGKGGQYGGGGGGSTGGYAAAGTYPGGLGGDGIIVLTYTPYVARRAMGATTVA